MYGAQRAIIAENFSFYNNLSTIDKRYFEHRVLKFIDAHTFTGREGVVVTKTMEILIASTAIMLTFGMRRYLFSQFENIIIYPKNYLSKVTNKRHQGETNPRLGTIVFSWDNFMDGINIEDNNLNLGLHELTHAMHFSFLKEKSFTSVVFLDHFTALLNRMKDIKLTNKEILFIPKFSKSKNQRYADNCVTIRVKDNDLKALVAEANSYLEFRITLKHGFSNLSGTFTKKYRTSKCIVKGEFEFGNSFNIS